MIRLSELPVEVTCDIIDTACELIMLWVYELVIRVYVLTLQSDWHLNFAENRSRLMENAANPRLETSDAMGSQTEK